MCSARTTAWRRFARRKAAVIRVLDNRAREPGPVPAPEARARRVRRGQRRLQGGGEVVP